MRISFRQVFKILLAACVLLSCKPEAEQSVAVSGKAALPGTPAMSNADALPGAGTPAQAAAKANAVAFEFAAVPSTYRRVELHGPGSETILAPAAASVGAAGELVTVTADNTFSVTVGQNGPSLEDFKPSLGQLPVVLEQPDVIVYGANGTFNFRVARSLTPEWDETDTRRLYCYGGAAVQTGAIPAPTLTKEQVQERVAACRSLELPGLE